MPMIAPLCKLRSNCMRQKPHFIRIFISKLRSKRPRTAVLPNSSSASRSEESTLKIFSARVVAYLWSIALVTLLGACGGGGSGSTVPGGVGGAPPPPATATLTLTTSTNTISASVPATLSATLKDAGGSPVANALVKFATQGVGFGVFFPTGGTALTNTAGVAIIALNAGIQVGADTVTATATVGSAIVVSAPLGFTVTAAPITSTPAAISFVSATPTTIAIKGAGGQENSTVIFVVKDSNGNPIANQNVNFALSTTSGGLSLSSPTGTSGTNGQVSTTVRSGTTATPVRVQASLNVNAAINTVSSQLVVSTAIPHQNGFSLSVTKKNIEAFTVDNVMTTFNVILSDRYGNYVPDGTAVSFRTQGGVGQIGPSCFTQTGQCHVDFSSAGVRPSNGRLTVLATSIGEESFVDLNGNGLYDVGEPFVDLPEAFIDANGDGVRNPTEEFVDFNNNGIYDGPDGQFNGVLRAAPNLASSTINVRGLFAIVLSTGNAVVRGFPPTIALNHCVDGPPYAAVPMSFNFTVSDLNGNAMAPGTTIALSTTNGIIVSTPTTYTVVDDNIPVVGNPNTMQNFLVTLTSDATQLLGVCGNASTTGTLTVTVTSPRGVLTFQRVPVTD